MTTTDHIEEAGPELKLWMLPLILLQMICNTFSVMLSDLKEMRRTRPLPKKWQAHLQGLRESEWPVMVVLTEGARQILQGKDLTLTGIPLYPPPEDFLWSPPSSAYATQLRFEWLARFHADPEKYVRRHAQRILRRACSVDGRQLRALFTGAALVPLAIALMVSSRQQAASVEPRGRLARAALQLCLHPP